MTLLRVFPFIGAAVGIAAVVLSIIGVSTTYWFSTGVGIHAGLWYDCVGTGAGCLATKGGRPAALAITVSRIDRIAGRRLFRFDRCLGSDRHWDRLDSRHFQRFRSKQIGTEQ